MPLQIVRNNIVKMKTDAIVNAANSELAPGGGVCGAVFSAAGYSQLDAACKAIGHCDTGSAVITPGFKLCKYIIHAVGPVWAGGTHHEAELLRSAYLRSLELAAAHHLESISFPLLSAGIYGYPKAEAMEIAVHSIRAYLDRLEDDDLMVYLVLFDHSAVTVDPQLAAYLQIASLSDRRYKMHAESSASYNIPEAYVEEASAPSEAFYTSSAKAAHPGPAARPAMSSGAAGSAPSAQPSLRRRAARKESSQSELERMLRSADESFAQALLRLIDRSGLKDSDVYKKANIDRKLFSKIRSNPDYHPKKTTALAFAVALQLTVPETQSLLEKAGFTLSRSSKADIIIEYYLARSCFDIDIINSALFAYDQPLLGF